jgi:hypothetical protein
MKMTTAIDIDSTPEAIWNAISDIENCTDMISAIIKLEVIDKPENGFVGFKWRETREVFGKEAEETMWITDAVQNEYYRARAESHGSIYISELRIASTSEDVCRLTMSFEGRPQTFLAKLMSVIMMPFFKGSMIKMLDQDLAEIKQFVEKQN